MISLFIKGKTFILCFLIFFSVISVWAEIMPSQENAFENEALEEAEADPDYRYIPGNDSRNIYRQTSILNTSTKAEKEETVLPQIEETLPTDLSVIKVEEIPEETKNKDEEQEIIFLEKKEGLEEFKREIESVDFVPKGQWIIGLSVSYSQSNQDKYQFLILEGISGNTYSFKISPMVLFTVKADLALGGRFSYNRSLTKVANADIVLDSETSYSFDHLYRLSHNYYGAVLMRNYFSIGKSKRFGFFNEVGLQMGGGQTKLTTGTGEDLTGTYERNLSLNVGLTPGLCIFLSNYSALEVNVGLLGFNYTDTRAVKDQVYVSHRNSKSANFRINLFSITFGATFYL